MNQDTTDYLKRAEESIMAARHLLEAGDYPGFAVSRSYYAMFYCASALFAEDGRRFSSHGKVIGAFGYEYVRSGKISPRFHAYLKESFNLRATGDYEPGEELSTEEARMTLAHAEEFLSEIRRYLAATPSTPSTPPQS